MGGETRYDFIDFLKGVGIFLVVWGHTMFPRSVYIYSFHMPLFFFLSGFLHKDKPARQFIIGKINTVYIPYAIFTVLSWLFYLLRKLSLDDYSGLAKHFYKLTSLITGTADNGGNNPIWFLTCILVVSIAFLPISRIKNTKLRFGAVLCASLVGYLLSVTKISLLFNIYFNIDIAFSGMVFYYLGYIVKQQSFLSYLDSGRRWLLAVVVVLAEIAHIGTAYLNTKVASINWVNMAGNLLGNYFLFYLSAFLGIFVYVVIGYHIRRIEAINFLGMNSLLILATHKPLLLIFNICAGKFLNTKSEWYGLAATLVVLAISAPLIVFINCKAPFVTGKKPVFGWDKPFPGFFKEPANLSRG